MIFCVSRIVSLESVERRRAGRREAVFAYGGEKEAGRVFRDGVGRGRSWPLGGVERGRVARAHVVARVARSHPATGRAWPGKRGGRDAQTTLLPLRLRRRRVPRVRRRGRLRRSQSFRVVRLFGVRGVHVFVRRCRRLRLRLVLMYGGVYLNVVRRCRVAALNVVRLAVRFVRLAVRVLGRCLSFRQFDVAGDRGALARRMCGQAYAARHRTR